MQVLPGRPEHPAADREPQRLVNGQGQVLIQLREPTVKAKLVKQAEGKRVTRHLKKLKKRERGAK
ncbi:hypothetical protein LCGC14_2283320 [marine sediment metagenome]|uniref:Uncharacterized protein n=1 Tax=marine sediment metagenome TaxID=412755 RepID=A0A0F9CT90_9ZZZZ